MSADIFFADAVGLGQAGDDVADVGRLIALSAHGDGGHIGGIGLEDDTIQRYCCGEGFRQMAFLEGEHAANTQHKAVELEQLTSLLFVARKTMEHASGQVVRVPL